MICYTCKKEYEHITRSECKVCGFKRRRKEDINMILKRGVWSENEIEIIVYNILYKKYDYINEIVPLLDNKSLDDLIKLLSKDLTIRGQTPLKLKCNCSVCGKEYITNISKYLSRGNNYCSLDCRNNGFILFGSHKGDKNSRYNSKIIKCTNCGKEYLAPKNVRDKKNSIGEHNHFCCQECYWKYRSIHYVGELSVNYGKTDSEKTRREKSIRMTERICNGEIKQTGTKPHLKTDKILEDLSIKYTNEYNCKYHSLDIFLDNYNLGIEVMGDYWHGSPMKYKKDKLSKIQLKSIKQDKSKHTYVKRYHNFEILYLWEWDINNNIELCKKIIEEYISKNGILQDYNSFNYYVNSNGLLLKSELVKPYFVN